MIDLEGKGRAKGNGKGKTNVIGVNSIGVMHFVLIEVEDIALPCTIAVLDFLPVELLLGLDILLHHAISIDMSTKSLIIGSTGINIKC